MAPLPSTRRAARERALELLYEADRKGATTAEIVDQLPVSPDDYALAIALGAGERVAEHDAVITAHLRKDWALARIPLLDKLILRLALEELGHQPDTPPAVVIDEAVELAKSYSTDESGGFINGVLSAVLRERAPTEQ